MAELVGHLANCIIEGDSYSDVDGVKIKNKIVFQLKSKTFEIIQSPELFDNRKSLAEYQGKFIRSTRVVVNDVEEKDISYYSDVISKLASLLSFITTSQVVYTAYEYPAGKIRQVLAVLGRTDIMHHVLELHRGDEIREFIVNTWENFENNYDIRKLPLIFDYISQAFSVNTVETKLVFSYVTLESLKYTFAKEKGYTFSKGSFQDHNKKRLSFNKLIEMMLSELGIVFNVNEITELRNDIIHSGYTEKTFDHNFKIFIYCQHIIREYLIKLLGYRGYYILVR
jgi:hypothetical protein